MRCLVVASALLGVGVVVDARNNLSRTPPMGWMSWELFRCDVDCDTDPEECIGERMYKGQVDALRLGGFVDAGYTGIHMDDCWEDGLPWKTPMRDPKSGRLQPNSTRLGDYVCAHQC